MDRIIADRPEQERRCLVKWEGLPYSEATWETLACVMGAGGGQAAVQAFQVSFGGGGCSGAVGGRFRQRC